jgi:hypothetical protein
MLERLVKLVLCLDMVVDIIECITVEVLSDWLVELLELLGEQWFMDLVKDEDIDVD